ncbi:GNAT family N-acetyltransferase [Loigolactobacillus binensis]|uniref:GNAT family N-acetyltransferase n=1 Tax=Loigolactobacillus binensis TaxID=2559922 RepID=A0ABW3EFC8_9LACO|nr:GNAT family N-acetyltransferase [Loigolactobacillus binensis]
MAHSEWLQTKRIGFSQWQVADLPLAQQLWGNPQVTHFISQHGFTDSDIQQRLQLEIQSQTKNKVQYWPLFRLKDQRLIGCCGLHRAGLVYELGYHLLPEMWHQGFATEATQAVLGYAFQTLKINKIVAGHHPANLASGHVLKKCGFQYSGTEFYAPTGLQHPTYELTAADFRQKG